MKNIFITIILSTGIIFASGNYSEVDKQIMNLSMNYEFDEADKLLAKEFSKSESLKNHYLYLSVEIMKVEDKADKVPFNTKRETKEKLNTELINYGEEIVERYEDHELSTNDKFYLASIHGILGRLYGVQRSWMSAFSEGKSGRNLMEEVIEVNPEYTDAYLLLGMMNYYADRMGGVIEFVAGILGLSGDRNLGLEYLNNVVNSGDLNKWQATMVLMELYSRMEGNKYAAIPLLEKLVLKFPNNTKFINWLSYDYISTYQYDKLGELISEDKENQINDFIKALYFSNTGRFKEANIMYDELLSKENTTWPGVYENAKFVRIVNHKLLGNEALSRDLSKELNERYTNYYNLYTNNFDQLREIENFKISVRNNEVEDIEKFIRVSINVKYSDYVNSQINFYTGVYLFNNNRMDEAEKSFLKSKELNPNDYGFRVSQYLIHIYKNIDAPIEKVEKLLDEIDEFDNDGLEFFAQDLELKYNL